MKPFKDSAGREWSIAINVDAVKRVRAAVDVNLLGVLDGGELLERLATDPVVLCDILFVLCRDQAVAAGVDDVAFGRAMAGDAIDRATTAFLAELVEFFPLARRQHLQKVLEKYATLQAMALQWAAAKIESGTLETNMRRMLESDEASGPGGSAGNSPASAASSPAP